MIKATYEDCPRKRFFFVKIIINARLGLNIK